VRLPTADSRIARVTKTIIFALVPVIVLTVSGHLVASFVTHRELAFEVDSLTGVTHYRTRVGAFPWSHRSVTRLNTAGFPDEEYTNRPPKGNCFHVVLSGDSFTFGDVTDGDKTWGSLLRDRISARHREGCVRVFNIAAPVTTIEQQIKRIHETLPVLQPDLILLGQYQNDITDLTLYGGIAYRPATATSNTTNWGDRLRQTVPGFDSPLPRMLTYRAFEFFIEHDIHVDILRRWSVLADSTDLAYGQELTAIYDSLYDGLADTLRARAIDFGVVIMPSKMDLMADRYPEGEFFARLARSHDVPAVAVFDALDARRDPMPFYRYDGHFDERGNRIVADSVYAWLFDGATTPFAALRAAAGPALEIKAVPGFPK
jgi:lysophospholipase L1-like esterase